MTRSELGLVDELLATRGADEAADRCVEILRRRFRRPMLGVYLLEDEGRPRHAAVWGVSDVFAARYERGGREIDPVLAAAIQRRAVTYNLTLMPLAHWRRTEVYRRVAYLDRFAHVVIAPAVSGGRVTATVHVGDDDRGRPFGPAELREVAAMSRVLSVVLREHRRRAGDRAGATHAAPATASGPGLTALTRREREVAALVVEELTDAEIGRALHVSPHTVRQHLKNSYRKLEVRSRVGLTRKWLAGDAAGSDEPSVARCGADAGCLDRVMVDG